jgi:hypothetical protein
MKARIAVLADAANVAVDGKLNVLGEFNVLNSAEFPAVWPRMFLVLKVESDLMDGRDRYEFRMRMTDQDGERVGGEIVNQFGFAGPSVPGTPRTAPMIIEIRNSVFQKPGTYEFHVLIDGETLTTVPLYVRSAPPMQPGQPGQHPGMPGHPGVPPGTPGS